MAGSPDWIPLETKHNPGGYDPLTGKRTYFREGEGGRWEFKSTQDVEPLLEQNKALQNMETHRAGYSPSGEFRRIADIPAIIILKWLNEEGINIFDPNHKPAVMRKLRDPEYRYLRTALWNI